MVVALVDVKVVHLVAVMAVVRVALWVGWWDNVMDVN